MGCTIALCGVQVTCFVLHLVSYYFHYLGLFIEKHPAPYFTPFPSKTGCGVGVMFELEGVNLRLLFVNLGRGEVRLAARCFTHQHLVQLEKQVQPQTT